MLHIGDFASDQAWEYFLKFPQDVVGIMNFLPCQNFTALRYRFPISVFSTQEKGRAWQQGRAAETDLFREGAVG